ncbi:MAG: DUF6597 domain-containing transcriptional factor, partial [Bryobacteraceae bacterium]
MDYRVIPPGPAFAAGIECYWALEGEGGGVPQTIFPDGCVELVFHYGDRFYEIGGGKRRLQARRLVAGQATGPVVVAPSGRAGCFGVKFKPGGARRFLGYPLSEITGQIASLDGAWAREAKERIAEAVSDRARV